MPEPRLGGHPEPPSGMTEYSSKILASGVPLEWTLPQSMNTTKNEQLLQTMKQDVRSFGQGCNKILRFCVNAPDVAFVCYCTAFEVELLM